jgi:glycosyltransferase involved in cell wall biosynthesis
VSSSRGPLRFLRYHFALGQAIRSLPTPKILFSCDLYSSYAAAKQKKNALLLYDAREVYASLPTTEHKPLVRGFWKRWERQGLSQTDIVVTTAPLDGEAIRQIHSFLPANVVVKNMPMLRQQQVAPSKSLREHFGIPHSKKIIVYVGGLQFGRGLEASIRAVRSLPDVALVLIGDGVLIGELKELARREGLSGSVFFYGPAASDDVIALLTGADLGISLIERTSGSYRLALPSKVFEYLHAGIPVVSSPLIQVKACINGRPYIVYADENSDIDITNAIRQGLHLSENIELRKQILEDADKEFVFEHDAEILYAQVQQITR